MKVLLIFLLLFPLFGCAQLITWDKTYDLNEEDYGGGIVKAYDGGYIMTGYTGESEWPNLLVIKLSNYGDTIWTRTYPAEGHSKGSKIIRTYDSCYMITGFTCENEYYFLYKMFIMKIDQIGDTVWTKTHGETNMGAGSIVKTFDGNYVISGGPGPMSIAKTVLLKLNGNGEEIWEKTYVFEGSPTPEGLVSLEQTADSGFIMAGSKAISSGFYDVLIMKLDMNGDSLWTKLYGEPSVHDWGAYALPVDAGGYIISAGRDVPNYSKNKLLIMKIDNSGTFLWEKIYEGNVRQGISNLKKTTNNDYIGTGYYLYPNGGGDLSVVRFNNFGDTLWTRNYNQNASSGGRDIIQTDDQGFIVSGGSSNFNGFLRDIRVLKLDESGLVQTKEANEVASNIYIRNFPNPFIAYTNIEFEITEPESDAKIQIYNSNGIVINEFEPTEILQGVNSFRFDAKDLSPGIYYCTLETPSSKLSSKMIKIQ